MQHAEWLFVAVALAMAVAAESLYLFLHLTAGKYVDGLLLAVHMAGH